MFKLTKSSVLALLLAFAMIFTLVACTGNNDTTSPSPDGGATDTTTPPPASDNPPPAEPVDITYTTYRVGAHVSAKSESIILDAFRAQYGDSINLIVEELPGDDAYVEKMKVLAASKDLPDIVEGKQGIIDLAIKNGQAIDLNPYYDADPQFRAEIGEAAIKANLRDGKSYSVSNGAQLIGYFYNKDMFQQAGITPAKTWDEFDSNCAALKSAGFTPLALMTGENAWTSNLLLCSIIGTSGQTGNDFMNTLQPTNYNTPEVIGALGRMQKYLKDYTTADALGAGYANAANNFLQEKAAMIANGPWMTPDFSDTEKAAAGLAGKVGVALYPEDGIVSQYEVGYMVCAKDPAKVEAAVTFLKFKTGAYAQKVMLEENGTLPLTNNVEMTDAFKTANPLIVDLINVAGAAKYHYANLDNTAFPNVMDQFAKYYPDLSSGTISAEEMATKLTEAASKG